MRILHTSDWHLGHTLHGLPRDYEHGRFLDWLLETVVRERVDALLIAGDVFDTANPSARAQRAYYDFLARAHQQSRHLQVVVIAGNHDSAQRLQAPREILSSMRVHVVGDAREADGSLAFDRMVVPLEDRGGQVRAWCAAVPFLRPADLPVVQDEAVDPLVEGVRRLYTEVLDAARARQRPGQALLAMGHCFMVGTEVSNLSERKILGGNQHALPVKLFGDDLDYVALGHLHKAQRVGKREHVRYCGSPIPLSMGEARYAHQVCLVEWRDGAMSEVQSPRIPRAVDLVRVPRTGAAPIEEVLEALTALPALEDFATAELRPFLEVCVSLDRPLPDVRTRVETALDGRAPRLVKISLERPGGETALADLAAHQTLSDITPEQVFRELYTARHGDTVPDALLDAFHELMEKVQSDGEQP